MGQIKGLQALRGIAASAVVFSHAYTRAQITWPEPMRHSVIRGFHDLVWLGEFGVDLFFVLSGFLMVYLHGEQFGATGASRPFLLRRLARIVPLYWALSAAGLVLLLRFPSLFTFHTSTEWPWIVGSFLFVPWPTSSGFIAPIIGAGWTLDYEMYFYLLFATALLTRRGLTYLCIFLLTSVAVGFVVRPNHPWLQLITNPLLLEFTMGMLTAVLVRRYKPRSALGWVIVPVLWLASTALHYPGNWRALAWGLPSAILVAGVVWMERRYERRSGRALVLLGDASYSIYLFQVFALPGFSRVFAALRFERYVNIDLLLAAIAVASIGAGLLVWGFLEKPLTQAIKIRMRGAATIKAPSGQPRQRARLSS